MHTFIHYQPEFNTQSIFDFEALPSKFLDASKNKNRINRKTDLITKVL